MAKKKAVRRKKVAAGSIGLTPAETKAVEPSALGALAAQVEEDGGSVLGQSTTIRSADIRCSSWRCRSSAVEPTPYQRDPSDAHVKRLMGVIEKIGLFLDPIIAIRHEDQYWTPNGNHRLQALKKLGVRTVVALLVPDPQVAFKILALNTEKAHNLREKSLETIRMARALAGAKRRATRRERLRLRVRAAGVSDARRRLRGAAAPERRRLPADPAPRRRVPRRADEQGAQGARAPRPQDPEAGRRGERRRGEAEGERADQPVPEAVRRRARELHAVLEGDVVRLRRNAGQDHRERAEVQHRADQPAGRREGRRRCAAGRRDSDR